MDTGTSGKAVYTIVVGIDGLQAGQAALLWAVGEARAHKAYLRVIHAWTSPYSWRTEEVPAPPNEASLRLEAQRCVEEAISGVNTKDVMLKAEVIEGDPRRVLVDAASDAQLLVVGSNGCGSIRAMLQGSVSDYCSHHTNGTVVLVRP